MDMTFGTFIRQQRQSKGYSLRQLAAEAGLSPVYMSNIETDRRPAPVQDLMDKLAEVLDLCKSEYELMLDLAEKSHDQRVSSDLPDYIMDRDIVRAALRTAKEADATDQEWQEFIDRINQRLADSKG